MQFKNRQIEKEFQAAEEAFSPLSLLGGPLIMMCASPVWRLQSMGPFTYGGIVVVSLFGVVLAFATCLGTSIRARWLKRILALMMISSMVIFILLDMVSFVTGLFITIIYIIYRKFLASIGKLRSDRASQQNFAQQNSGLASEMSLPILLLLHRRSGIDRHIDAHVHQLLGEVGFHVFICNGTKLDQYVHSGIKFEQRRHIFYATK